MSIVPNPSSARPFEWTAQREQAALLCAQGELGEHAIARQLSVGRMTIRRWRENPAFHERLQQHVDSFRAAALAASVSPDFASMTDVQRRRVTRITKQPRGVVYFVQADNGLVKIGTTVNLSERFGAIQTCSPCAVRLLHTIACAHPYRAEKALHARFAQQRSHGEWFALSEHDIASILKD